MSDPISFLLVGLGAIVLTAGVLLFVLKAIRRGRRLREHRRRQRYVDLVGELIVRGELKGRSFARNAKDPVYRSVVQEYLRILQGRDRDNLLVATREMGLVARYVDELRSFDRDKRVSAVEALGEIADPITLEDLVFALSDDVPEVRVQAASALAGIGDPIAVKSLLLAMDREEEWNAQRLADSLFTFGREAVPDMSRYLQGTGRYRPLVARTLGLIGDLRAEDSLIQALGSTDDQLRLRAAAALGRAGSVQSVPFLLEALGDPVWEVRAQAASALGRRMDREAVPWLRKALTDDAWWVRHNAASALAEMPGGVEALQASLDHPDPYARDAAAAVLLSWGAAGNAMEEIDSDDPMVRYGAEDMISKLTQLGKADFFLAAGMEPERVEALRRRSHGRARGGRHDTYR